MTKIAANRQDTKPARSGMFQFVRFVLGVVLIAAGVLKLYQIAFESQDESFGMLLLMAYAEAEFLGGIWMVGGFDAARGHPWTVAAFAGLAAASLSRGLAGKCTCGCFGAFAVTPWAVLVLDLAALAALLAWRPPTDPEATLLDHPARLLGLGFLAIVIGVAGWWQTDTVALAGTATRDGRPLAEATLTFTGESNNVAVRTDADGRFRVPLAGPGRYAVAFSGAPEDPAPTHGLSAGPAAKKSAGRSKRQPTLAATDAVRTLSWIEVSGCSEEDRTIEFR